MRFELHRKIGEARFPKGFGMGKRWDFGKKTVNGLFLENEVFKFKEEEGGYLERKERSGKGICWDLGK